MGDASAGRVAAAVARGRGVANGVRITRERDGAGHVRGLPAGRYGDTLDPDGTRKAAIELARVLAPKGDLYLALPVGRPRVSFNAHRIHSAAEIPDLFPELELAEFSGVHDDGSFNENTRVEEFNGSDYACGMYWFRNR
ncbi:MAG: DUF268 domain-containing protein [Gemmatimonadetes bacterium]|nr:DUF268 domain-containing protein [Gemmatimonadota bacterium]